MDFIMKPSDLFDIDVNEPRIQGLISWISSNLRQARIQERDSFTFTYAEARGRVAQVTDKDVAFVVQVFKENFWEVDEGTSAGHDLVTITVPCRRVRSNTPGPVDVTRAYM